MNTNPNGIFGTKATNESVAIGENVIANDGSIALGKNGLSATDASIGIGRMGVARGASVLVSNDLYGRNNTPFSGKIWAYYDKTEEKYKPFDKYDSVTYKNYQTIQNKIYNKNTSAFESLYFHSPIYILFLNTWDGSIGYLTSAVSYGRQYFSGYYDENNNFIKVNSQSEVPSTATLIQVFSANANNGFSYRGNNIFTTTLNGVYTTTNYSDSPYIRNIKINGYILSYDNQYNYHLYESCLNRNNTNTSSLYNFLKQYEHLSGYVDENALNGLYYEDIKYDAETDTIFNTTDNIVDYWTVNGQKVYPKDISEQTFIDLDEERTYSDANSVAIGMGLSSYGNSIAINAGTDVSPYYAENRTLTYCRSGTIGNMLTGNSNYTAYLSDSYSANKEIKSKDNIVTAYGKSIVLGADGKNISAGGNSIAIGNHDINVTGKSIGIGNNIYSLNQSIVINQNAWGRTPTAMNQSLVIGGNGSWAQGNSFIFGEGNSANNNAYVFGQGNSANGRTFAFGEANYIATGRSFALGYYNYINGQTEVCTIGYRNYANGGSMQNVIMGYDNYMSVGGYALHLIGNKNSASCGSVYGSVIGNWNMLSHGNSLLAIHGDNNSAFGSLGEANIFGHYNVVGGGSQRITVIGYNNGQKYPGGYGSFEGIVLGTNNSWCGGGFKSSIIGINNDIYCSYTDATIIGNDNRISASEDGVIIGNSNYIRPHSADNSISVRNFILGNNNSAGNGQDIGSNLDNVLIGFYNYAISGNNIAIGNYNNVMEQSYAIGSNNYANIDGDNLIYGVSNTAAFEALSIGKNNKSYGHSIILGWNNYTNTDAYSSRWYNPAHSILIGSQNQTKNSQGYIYEKSYTYLNQKILSNYETEQIQNEIAELEEQRTTAYQNFANKANEIYSLLTANGLDSVSAENYINGTLYSSGYGHEYISPYTPWAIQNYPYDISYQENGTWYTGYGESAYVKRWIYSTSSYSSYNTSDYYYKYYWLPAKQASATWSIVSSIYTAQYGSDSANRYNEVNIANQHIYELTQAINNKQYVLTQNPITASGTTDSHNIETMSFVAGNNNSADHHNSIIIGSENHTLKMLDTNTTGDDGFTVAIGVGNTVARNYDMAIGYGSIASGGENIAIGAPQTDEYGYYPTATQAIGYKNIAIRSNITGIGNIAINTHFAGNIMGIFDTGNYRYKINDNNKFYNSTLQFNASDENYWYISNNIINNADLTADLNNYFVYNNVTDLQGGYFSGSLTHNDFIHNNNLTVKTKYTTDGVESNLFYNTDSLSAEVDECSHNIFSHIIGNIVAQQSHNNMLFNSTINVSADKDEWRGFSNNFAQNSTITGVFKGLGDCFIFDSTAYFNNSSWGANNANVLFYSRYITNTADYALPQDSVVGYSVKEGEGQNFLFGTMGINLHSVFSFSDKFDLSATPNTLPRQEPYLMNCCRVYNFGDNTMINAANIDCAGEDNFIQGIKIANINGNYNFVVTDYVGDNSDFIGIYGQSNTYLASGTDKTTIGYNTIIGSNNNINVTNSGDNYNSSTVRNIIIGSENSYHSVKTSSFGNYTNLVNFYRNNNNNIGSYYESSLPVGDRTIGFPLQFANRNTIVGQHSVISDAINDSIIVGSNNLIYNTTYETKGNNFGTTDVISNNFTLGSYNLLKDGSNQINIGVGNNTSGFNATAIGEGLIAKTSQMVVGRFNAELDGTNGISANDIDNTSGALFIVGNGYHKLSDYETTGCIRSNAMIVSADGTVSAKRFVEAEPSYTLTGGTNINVVEDNTTHVITVDLNTTAGLVISELSALVTNKPTTGKYIIGCENGMLTWVEVTTNA